MSASPSLFVAIDLGASHGRTVLGRLVAGRLEVEIVHRFEHAIRSAGGHARWDWSCISAGVTQGLVDAAGVAGDEPIVSISCDAWAQDFGLINKAGDLAYPPVSYRDPRCEQFPPGFFDRLSQQEIMARVGGGSLPISTLCQLRTMATGEAWALADGNALLHIADLVHHQLCGRAATDWTLATVSQLRNLESGRWDEELLDGLSIPVRILPPLQSDPTVLGGMDAVQAPHPALIGVPVVTVANHDTAAASFAAMPLDEETIFLSAGTYAMLGCTLPGPVVPRDAARKGCALAGMGDRRWELFYPVPGLWVLQECCRQWEEEGTAVGYDELVQMARAAMIESLVPLSDSRFSAPCSMLEEIVLACRDQGMRPPEGPGEFARVVVSSLARCYCDAMTELARMTGQHFRRVHLVSGGSRNGFLCQELADRAQVAVLAGPAEAAATGNILLQARLNGAVADGAAAGEILDRSFRRRLYESQP